MLRVACVLAARELGTVPTDVIVFPEGVDRKEIAEAGRSRPDAVIVGAITDGVRCRGVLLHRGRQRINYLKVGNDGRTQGTGVLPATPVYEFGGTCVGVLICMDIQPPRLFQAVIGKLRASTASAKLLCIPADMSIEWFSSDVLPPHYSGVAVALCNHTKTYEVRCKTFIADATGRKIVVQRDVEPIRAELC